MALLVLLLAAWSLVAAVLLKLERATPGGLWGWSWVGNLLQGVGLLLVSATLFFESRFAAGRLWGMSSHLWLALPWLLVLAGVALRVRARRAAADAAVQASSDEKSSG